MNLTVPVKFSNSLATLSLHCKIEKRFNFTILFKNRNKQIKYFCLGNENKSFNNYGILLSKRFAHLRHTISFITVKLVLLQQ